MRGGASLPCPSPPASTTQLSTPTHTPGKERLERPWAVRDEGRADFLDAVGKGELELGNQKLLDVGTANVVGLLDLHDTENLIESKVRIPYPKVHPYEPRNKP